MKLERADVESLGRLVGQGFSGIENPTVSIDSRSIKQGDVFVALRGEKNDGHEFVKAAFENGAQLAVVNHVWFEKHGAAFFDKAMLVSKDTLSALQQLARVYRRKFAVPIVAIGGNCGKTTTKEMTAAVLRSTYNVLATEGNLNNHIGVPLTLFGLRASTEIAVIEMGMNHAGEMTQLCSIAEPTHGLITNIGKAHIEFFSSEEAVAEAEGELFAWLSKTGGSMLVNVDDEQVMKQAGRAGEKKFYGVKRASIQGISAGHDVEAEELSMDDNGCVKFRLTMRTGAVEVQLRISGRHNIYNALAAAAVGYNFGVLPERIKDALENFEINPALKRMSVSETGGVVLINDTYNANPESMRAGLQTLADMKNKGKKIAVLGDMLELGKSSASEHKALGEFITTLKLDALLTFGTETKRTLDAATVKETKAHFKTKADLANALKSIASRGDAILFKGSRGMKMEEVFEAMKEHLRLRNGH